jgi:hypothetical protein
VAIACGFSYDSAYDLLKANGRKCSRGIRLRPLLERALLKEYRFKWIAFPAILPAHVSGRLLQNIPARKMDH